MIISEQTPGLLSLLKRQNALWQYSAVHQGIFFFWGSSMVEKNW